MPFSDSHISIARVCSNQGCNFNSWGKSGELDKLFLLLVDQIDGRASYLTRTKRLQALVHYMGLKYATIDNGMFDNIENGELRANSLGWTFNNSLTRQDAIQFGLSGRFHRVFMSTLYETTADGGAQSEKEVFQIWLNTNATALRSYFNIIIPPLTAELSAYRINSDPTQENTGGTITVPTGARLRLYSTGLSYNSQIWQKDIVDITGETADMLDIDAVAAGDAGVYRNSFTNANGTAYGPDFTVAIS